MYSSPCLDSAALAQNYVDNKRPILPVLYCDTNANDRLFPLQKKIIKLEAHNCRKQSAINFLSSEIGTIELTLDEQQDIIDLEDIVVTESNAIAASVLVSEIEQQLQAPTASRSNDMDIGNIVVPESNEIAASVLVTEIGQQSQAPTASNMDIDNLATVAKDMQMDQPSTSRGAKDSLAGDHFFVPNVRHNWT